jgi:hypothetical protein
MYTHYKHAHHVNQVSVDLLHSPRAVLTDTVTITFNSRQMLTMTAITSSLLSRNSDSMSHTKQKQTTVFHRKKHKKKPPLRRIHLLVSRF